MNHTYKLRTRAEAIDTRVWDLLTVALFLGLSAMAFSWLVPR
jgi:hypothetical protein